MLCDDIAKKARNSRQAMWAAIHQERAAYREAYDGQPTFIEPTKWPLPDVEEQVQPYMGPNYILQTVRGKGGAVLKKATSESNAERERVLARKLV